MILRFFLQLYKLNKVLCYRLVFDLNFFSEVFDLFFDLVYSSILLILNDSDQILFNFVYSLP